MNKRIICLCMTIALLLGLIPCIGSGISATAAADKSIHLTGVQVFGANDRLLETHQFLYDAGRLTRVLFTAYEYSEYTIQTDLTYDANGKLLTMYSNDLDNPGIPSGFEHSYNSEGQLINTYYSNSEHLEDSYEYDASGKLTRLYENLEYMDTVTEYHYTKGLMSGATITSTDEYSSYTETLAYSYDSQKRLSSVMSSGPSNVLTTYHYQYSPFVVTKSVSNYGTVSSEVILQDDNSAVLYQFSFHQAEFYTDANGKLAKVVATDSFTDEVLTYTFLYDNTAPGTVYPEKATTWNRAYFNCILNGVQNPDSCDDWLYADYNLVYLDDDSIPELWITHSSLAGGCSLLSFRNNKLLEEDLSAGGLVYEEYGNCFYLSSGRMGYYYDTVYALEKGKLTTLATGSSEEFIDSLYNVSTTYYWDNIQVSETIYQSKLDSYVYPGIAKTPDNGETYDFLNILDYLFCVDPSSTPGPPKKVPAIRAFTTLPHSYLAVNQERQLLFSLFMSGKPMAIEDCTVTVSDPTVMEVVNTSVSDISRMVTLKGLKPGTAELTFTETATKAKTVVSITVKDTCRYYKCSTYPGPEDPSGGIYIDDYACTVISNGNHSVTFYAYNTTTQAGYARVYDEGGTLIKEARLAGKYGAGDKEYGSIKFYWAWEDLDKLNNGNTPFYESPYEAIRTSVRLENIPENALIRIFAEENSSEYIELHIAPHGAQNCLSSGYVSVTQADYFNEDTLLKAYRVSDAEELAALPTKAPAKMKKHNIYNITLLEKGSEVQPDGQIEVRIPVPEGADGEKCIVYRIEEDGSKTLLCSNHENGYISFNTDHLSYYIVGEYPRPASKPIEEPDLDNTESEPPVTEIPVTDSPVTDTPATGTALPETGSVSAFPAIGGVVFGGLLSVLVIAGLGLLLPMVLIAVIVVVIIMIVKKRKNNKAENCVPADTDANDVPDDDVESSDAENTDVNCDPTDPDCGDPEQE